MEDVIINIKRADIRISELFKKEIRIEIENAFNDNVVIYLTPKEALILSMELDNFAKEIKNNLKIKTK